MANPSLSTLTDEKLADELDYMVETQPLTLKRTNERADVLVEAARRLRARGGGIARWQRTASNAAPPTPATDARTQQARRQLDRLTQTGAEAAALAGRTDLPPAQEAPTASGDDDAG